MRLSGIRLPLLAAAAWAGIGLTVYANDFQYRETIYVSPTSTTVSLSPAYVVSRSYVVPTDFIVPSYIPTSASYIATSYYAERVTVLPTTYVATTYRRGLFGRRWMIERPLTASYGVAYVPSSLVVPTTYYPSSYRVTTYRPTVWQYPSVWETVYTTSPTICCDEVVLTAPTQLSSASGITSTPAASGASRPSDSVRREDPTIPSFVDSDAATPAAPLPETAKAKAQQSGTPSGRGDSPPPPPAARPDQTGAQTDATKTGQLPARNDATPKAAGAPTPKATPATPKAPDGEQDLQELHPAPPGGGSDTIRRDSLRPSYRQESRRVDRRNILFGTVESESGAAREEVLVSVVNRNNSLIHHDGISNAFGGFAIHVPDGQWTVKVTMPSGRVETVRNVTVTNGKVLDNREAREVFNLIITF